MIKDIVIPLVVASTLIFILNKIIFGALRFLGLDMVIIKIALLLAAWYFIGPVVYNFLLDNIIVNENEIMIFIYQPIQTLKLLLGL